MITVKDCEYSTTVRLHVYIQPYIKNIVILKQQSLFGYFVKHVAAYKQKFHSKKVNDLFII